MTTLNIVTLNIVKAFQRGAGPYSSRWLPRGLATLLLLSSLATSRTVSAVVPQDLGVMGGETGHYGGRLIVAERTEPKTLNPVTALDVASRDVSRHMHADLIHINGQTQRTEPSLAKTWAVSPDKRCYTLELRRGVRFSDGSPLSVEDILFSFNLYLDERVHSPQRDLLIVGGKPIQVERVGPYTLQFRFAQPDAAGDRIFDSIPILPQHLLEKPYREGKIAAVWGLDTAKDQIAGLGPFRLRSYVPGQQLVLERNPYYWKLDKNGNRLPYLDEIDFLFAANQDVQALRFEAGETDVISGLSAENFSALQRDESTRGYHLYDLGPGLEYDFLLLNLNALPADAPQEAIRRLGWFRQREFRQAISAATDRSSIVRLVYRGHASPLWAHVTPGNKLWFNSSVPKPHYSLERARSLLKSAGFRWDEKGRLLDRGGSAVDFSIITSAGNAPRAQIGAILQNDLAELGMAVHVVPLESHSLMDRVFRTHDYDSCVLGLVSADADPNPEMNVWLWNGNVHLWNLTERAPEWPWEAEIDQLMRRQSTTLDYLERKRLYDRVQLLVEENLPLICIVSPDVLAGGRTNLGNFSPTVMGDYTLWNVDQIFFKQDERPHRR